VKHESVFALPPGDVLGARVGDILRIENEAMRLVLDREGGEAHIYDPQSGEWLCDYNGYSGHNWPSEYWSSSFELSLERSGQQLVAVAATPSKEHPGFYLRKRLSIGGGPLITIEYDFDNLGADERRFRLGHWVNSDRSKSELTLPM